MSRGLASLGALPREWFRFVQICDAPAKYSTERDELIRIGRDARSLPRRRRYRRRRHPAPPARGSAVDRDSEHDEAGALGAEQYARLCIETARSYLPASAYRRAS
jgi:hypothetical protein